MDKTYCIPANYLDSGYILNGRFPKRNAIEAIVLFFLALCVCNLLPIPHNFEDGISYYVMIILPCVLIGATGIQGEPLSIYFMNAYKWRKARKPFFYNHHGQAYRVSAAQLIIDEPSMRDTLAAKLAQVRKTMTAPRIEYVEGENFVFADDPELEALREAEERLLEDKGRNDAESTKQAQTASQPSSGAEESIDFNDIMANIKLHDIEGDD